MECFKCIGSGHIENNKTAIDCDVVTCNYCNGSGRLLNDYIYVNEGDELQVGFVTGHLQYLKAQKIYKCKEGDWSLKDLLNYKKIIYKLMND